MCDCVSFANREESRSTLPCPALIKICCVSAYRFPNAVLRALSFRSEFRRSTGPRKLEFSFRPSDPITPIEGSITKAMEYDKLGSSDVLWAIEIFRISSTLHSSSQMMSSGYSGNKKKIHRCWLQQLADDSRLNSSCSRIALWGNSRAVQLIRLKRLLTSD